MADEYCHGDYLAYRLQHLVRGGGGACQLEGVRPAAGGGRAGSGRERVADVLANHISVDSARHHWWCAACFHDLARRFHHYILHHWPGHLIAADRSLWQGQARCYARDQCDLVDYAGVLHGAGLSLPVRPAPAEVTVETRRQGALRLSPCLPVSLSDGRGVLVKEEIHGTSQTLGDAACRDAGGNGVRRRQCGATDK